MVVIALLFIGTMILSMNLRSLHLSTLAARYSASGTCRKNWVSR